MAFDQSAQKQKWLDNGTAMLPCSPEWQVKIGKKKYITRWEHTKNVLTKHSQITSAEQLEVRRLSLISLHSTITSKSWLTILCLTASGWRAELHYCKTSWSLTIHQQWFQWWRAKGFEDLAQNAFCSLDWHLFKAFFERILPYIIKSALRLADLFPDPVRLLTAKPPESLSGTISLFFTYQSPKCSSFNNSVAERRRGCTILKANKDTSEYLLFIHYDSYRCFVHLIVSLDCIFDKSRVSM